MSLVDGFAGFNLTYPGFFLADGNATLLGLSNAYAPAVASQPNIITNALGLPASISVPLLNVGQTFQVRTLNFQFGLQTAKCNGSVTSSP